MAIISLEEYWKKESVETYFFDIFPIVVIKDAFVDYIDQLQVPGNVVCDPIFFLPSGKIVYSIFHGYLNRDKIKFFENPAHTGEIIALDSGAPIASHYYLNFWHFIMEVCPRITALEKTGFTGPYIFPEEGFSPHFLDWLKYLSIPEKRILITSKTVFIRKAYLPVPVAHGVFNFNGFYGSLLKQTREFLLSPVRGEISAIKDAPIFITRKRKPKLLNEASVFNLIKRFGCEIVAMEDLSLRQQIILAATRKKIAGIHGAGMAHCLFMPKFSSILEMFSHRYIMPCMFNVVREFGHSYHMCVERIPHSFHKDPERNARFADFYGHINVLDSMLREFVYWEPSKGFKDFYEKTCQEEELRIQKTRKLVEDYLRKGIKKV